MPAHLPHGGAPAGTPGAAAVKDHPLLVGKQFANGLAVLNIFLQPGIAQFGHLINEVVNGFDVCVVADHPAALFCPQFIHTATVACGPFQLLQPQVSDLILLLPGKPGNVQAGLHGHLPGSPGPVVVV